MKTNFTPGPWKVYEKSVLTDIGKPDFSQPVTIRKICDCDNNKNYVSDKEAVANAHLIAAAPDLYAVLAEILNSDVAMREEDEGRKSPLLRKARAALRKAGGVS